MENENKYLPQLLAERDSLDASFTHAMKLLSAEIEKVEKGETDKDTESYLDLFTQKNIKLKERVLIPVKQYPKFNFVGKILGPQGNTIKRLQEETGAKISVLGKGSMRDKTKEEGLRKSGEPKYAHLSMELHVFIEVFAPVPEAYVRMAHAMEEIKKFLFPDMMDEICQEQFMEMKFLNGGQEHAGRGRGGPPIRGRGGVVVCPHVVVVVDLLEVVPQGELLQAEVDQLPSRPEEQPPTAHSYDESYTEPGYESYDSYYSQPQAEPEYYDYGHGETQEGYENYAQDDWNGTQRPAGGGKAPAQRQTKPGLREHPYGRY
ncbi:KH domain-containing, RNA-binding, signal transduction-associated protein 1 [Labeo rohita]|uniref:KH domain-containing, RNA-binding, signal transduction-associated protein 1 n=1 Tax=Labeo rohita TaxID=84645 RepID=A0ABQ8LQM7_LABRO|nr:KH domain-containing, RNA-binding, signal transduction-associated protein 1 [Labeo rohita]